MRLLDVATPKDFRIGVGEGMNLHYLIFGPKTLNLRPLSRRHKFELVSSPWTDLSGYVPVPVLPHQWPKRSQKCRNFVVPVQLSQQEEVIVPSLIEEKL